MSTDPVLTRTAPTYEPTASGAPSPRPLAPADRLALVDVLRGIAILGVLVAYTLWNLGSPPSETWSRTDHLIDRIGETLVDTKFISIFAFLFGVGTAQQWRRAASNDRRRAIHVRRMLFLLAIGLVHGLLLRNGDILAPYAILGLVLYGARTRSTRVLVGAAIVLAIVPYAVQVAMKAAGWSFPDRPTGGSESANWTRYWKENIEWLRYWYITLPFLSWPRVLALMLAGVVADRAQLMPRIARERRLALLVLAVALPLAIITRTTFSVLPAHWDAHRAPMMRGIGLNQLYYLAGWSLAVVYIAAFALLCQRPGWPARLQWLRAVGRMAFTNYLLQALIVVPICLAFGLFDTVTPTRGLLLALGVMAVEIPFSVWWLRRFEYGPVEWLWRRVTYGRAFATRSH